MSKIELNIADYLSIKDFKKATALEHLSETEKMVESLVLLTDKPKEEVIKWKPAQLQQVYEKVSESLIDVEPQFFPVVEVNGVKYGYNPLTNVSLGEYVDLENLTKDPQENLAQVMAVLYRPITKHKFKSLKWSMKLGYKKIDGLAEELFKMYDVEEYDSSTRDDRAKEFELLPVSFALGAYTFFLTLVNNSLISSTGYSTLKDPKKREMMLKKQIQTLTPAIGDGLKSFIHSLQHPSYPSMEIKVL